jgi:hypothetical protein
MALIAWAPNTAYTSGQVLVTPQGFVATVTANFTSGAAFDGAHLAYGLGQQALLALPPLVTTDTVTGLPVSISVANGELDY